ncbi:MAG: acyltransferase, partial [Kiritimatiellae bacterium]|nr:acyltransferase [Kiritimatiellia bacterium]
MHETTPRTVWIDWLRLTALFLVLVIHSIEPFFFGGDGTLIRSQSDAVWVSCLNAFARVCVPLFVVASSYLQFPLRYSANTFFKRRAIRVLLPFFLWTLLYAFLRGNPIENLSTLWQNFNYSAGHLWFVYMLIGIYLLMPLLSPWAENVSERELRFYLLLCLTASCLPTIGTLLGGDAVAIYGPSGIPNLARYPLWGEASWNTCGTFYYFSVFLGYVLLGLYFRRFIKSRSWAKTLTIAMPCWCAGFLLSAGGFYHSVCTSASTGFPVEGNIILGAGWERFLQYDSLGVALMTFAWLLCLRQITACGICYNRFILPLSSVSYGIYLCHMVILSAILAWLHPYITAILPGIW